MPNLEVIAMATRLHCELSGENGDLKNGSPVSQQESRISLWSRRDETPSTRGHDPSKQTLLMSWFSNTDLGAPRLATFSIARPRHSVVVTYFGKSDFHTG